LVVVFIIVTKINYKYSNILNILPFQVDHGTHTTVAPKAGGWRLKAFGYLNYIIFIIQTLTSASLIGE
jgi:hypothetical protein